MATINSKTLLELAEQNLDSANAVAEYLGVGKAFVSDVKARRKNLSALHIARLCDLVNLDFGVTLAAIEAEKEKDPTRRRYWLGKVAAASKAGASTLTVAAVVVLALFSTTQTAYAFTDMKTPLNIHYELYPLVQGVFRWVICQSRNAINYLKMNMKFDLNGGKGLASPDFA